MEVLPYDHIDKEQGVLSHTVSQEEYPLTSDGYLVVGNFTASVARGALGASVGAVDTLRLYCHSTSQNWLILSEVNMLP